MFGAMKDEVTRDWRRPHNEELYNLYCSPNISRAIKSRKNEMGGVCSTMGERRAAYRVLVGRPEGKRQL